MYCRLKLKVVVVSSILIWYNGGSKMATAANGIHDHSKGNQLFLIRELSCFILFLIIIRYSIHTSPMLRSLLTFSPLTSNDCWVKATPKFSYTQSRRVHTSCTSENVQQFQFTYYIVYHCNINCQSFDWFLSYQMNLLILMNIWTCFIYCLNSM